jgi:hypothetical protein
MLVRAYGHAYRMSPAQSNLDEPNAAANAALSHWTSSTGSGRIECAKRLPLQYFDDLDLIRIDWTRLEITAPVT